MSQKRSCDQCGKELCNYKSLWRHKKTCKGPRNDLSTLNEYNQQLYPQIKVDDKMNSYVQYVDSDDDSKDYTKRNSIYEQLRNADSEPPESDEDLISESEDETDGKIWKSIANWCLKAEVDALDGFRYWFEFCKKLDNDETIKKIMETVRVIQDHDQSLSFEDALQHALMKRKYLIYETLKVFKDEGIWKILLEEPDKGFDVFHWLTKYILACRSMKNDPIFKSINGKIQELMNTVDPMEYDEALSCAIESKADKIFTAVGDLPRDISSLAWDRISKRGNIFNVYSEVEYFIYVKLLIENDETFQVVLKKMNGYLEDDLSLDQALYKSVNENQKLIHDAFKSDDELWDSMKTDEFTNESEELDVFKAYTLYYIGLKRDELFQSIVKEMERLLRDDWSFTDAVKHAIQTKKIDIGSKVGKPWIPGLKFIYPIKY